ncbi:hypothetical protein AB3N58_17240 [Leptospira sp. WS60.C2]
MSHHVYQEITYKDNFLPRRINGVFYPIDHIIVFFGTKSSKKEFKLNGAEISKTRTKEGQSVTLFFYRDILIDYSIHQYLFLDPNSSDITLGENSTKDMRAKFKENNYFNLAWPSEYCDRKFYFYKHARPNEFSESSLKEDCNWEKADFEEQLKAEGYYKRKQSLDSGDFSALVREIQSSLKHSVY